MDITSQERSVGSREVWSLSCPRVSPPGEAGLCVLSLPWPCAPVEPVSLGGQPTYVKAIGQWPGQSITAPRRLLLVSDAPAGAPDHVRLSRSGASCNATPTAVAELIDRSQEEGFDWERHALRITHGGRSVVVRMGLRTGGAVQWWEACRLVHVETTPFCTVVHMGGAIARVFTDQQVVRSHPGYAHPLLHKHNWLYGDLFVRMYANGVCEFFAHFVNNRAVDEGGDLEDVVPVLGLQSGDMTDAPALVGPWDGSHTALSLGGVRFDVTEVARLGTPAQPGRVDVADGFLAIEPFLGVEMYGGTSAQGRTGDEFIFRAERKLFPRGMARTLRFTCSLNPQRSPRIARYIAPYWWYGHCRELSADGPWLPVSNAYDNRLDECRDWLNSNIVRGGFEDGSVARCRPYSKTISRTEPGWEGDVPYAQFLLAYRTGEAEDYDNAMRSAYFVTDAVIDHAGKLIRMHAFPPSAYALPMNRVLGSIAAYLETGDPYLLQEAEAVVEAAWRLHLNSWPRMAVGRDACFIRGAVMLYRYFDNGHFLKIAREAALHVTQVQRENGSFGDQGGGTGIHAWGAYITKPWMGLLATTPLLDYLELFPDRPEDEPLRACVQRFGDWMMKARWERDGYTGWSYQQDYDGKSRYFAFYANRWEDLPTRPPWHEDSIGRLMRWCASTTGDGSYLDAFAQSMEKMPVGDFDHWVAASIQCMPRLTARLWNARLTATGSVEIDPVHFGPRTPRDASIFTPAGLVSVRWNEDGTIDAPPTVVCRREVEAVKA